MHMAGRLVEIAKKFSEMAGREMFPLDLSGLPATELFTRHFDPSIEIRTLSESCAHYESRSSIGPESMVGFGLGLGLVANAVVPRVLDALGDTQKAKCAADIAAIGGAIRLFQIKNGGAQPGSLEWLVEADSNGARYLENVSVPKDPWGQTYLFTANGSSNDLNLWSCGPDGIDNQGSGDDITHKAILQGDW